MAAIYNVVEQNRASTQSGLALGAQMFNNSLRMQQLKSEQAMRQMEERYKAQQLSMLLQQQQLAIDERAEMAKAAAAIQAESLLTMPVSGPPEAGQGALPDVQIQQAPRAETIIKHTLPVVMKFRPQEAGDFMAKAALYDQRLRDQEDFKAYAQPITMPDGTVMQGVRSSRNSWTPVSTGDPEIKTVNGRQMRRNRYGDWVPMTSTPEEINKRQTGQKFLAEALKLDPSQVRMDEEGNAVITPQAWENISQRGSVTTATRGKMEQTILATQVARNAASDALRTINETPNALGAPGILREWIETGRGLMGSERTPEISIARDRLRKDFIKLSEDLKVDVGNLTMYERRKLEEAGDPTRWDQYLKRTAPNMQAMLDAATAKELRLSRQLGKDVDNSLLAQLPLRELQGLYDSELLNQADLVRLVTLKRLTADEALRIDSNKPKG